MIVGIPVESYQNELRVALVPAFVPTLVKAGLEVLIQRGAGKNAGFADNIYEQQGARLAPDRKQLFQSASIIIKVNGLGSRSDSQSYDLNLLRSGQVVLGLLNPFDDLETARELAARKITAFALELLPRITRAQPMDALSSMATLAGYKAVLLAASALDKIYPMMITAAGTITPAKVFVVGAGVAGLQAIATARRLGAAVVAYDVRPAVKEQVESLEAKFLELDLETEDAETSGGYAKAMGEDFYRRQREMMTEAVAESDVVITTAAIPGIKAPVIITEEMVRRMRPGSIVLDMAAEGGGNCELTRSRETIKAHGVSIMGPVNLPSTIPNHASQMYSKNVTAFLQSLVKDGELVLNMEDEIIRGTLLTHEGEVVNAQVRKLLGLPETRTSKDQVESGDERIGDNKE